ncbi:MAG: beta-propeller fold lactonase family protein [Phycisphaerales bacterium]
MRRTLHPRFAVAMGGSLVTLTAPLAMAQADDPIILVANEGNLEGSLTSMRVNPDGTLTFIDRLVTGTRSSTSQPCPGCNTYGVSISPNGRWAATCHAAGDAGEQTTIYEILPDGSLELADVVSLAQGGLDIQWLRDDLLAVPITDSSATNILRLYTWDEGAKELTFASSAQAGSFLTSVALHPNGQWLYANDSFANTVRVFEVSGTTLSLVQTAPISVYGVSLAVSPNGKFLYAAGGISAGGHAFAGYIIDQATGMLTGAIAGSPFTSPGSSPKGFAFTPDGSYLYVSHGTDATIRAFAMDVEAGVPTDTGYSFDVGLQGTLQGMGTLGGLLFACDDSTAIDGVAGAYSFTIDGGTGDFAPTPGAPVLTEGVSPNDIATWAGAPCPPDINGDGVLNLDDINLFADAFTAGDLLADADGNGILNLDDVNLFAAGFLAGCP